MSMRAEQIDKAVVIATLDDAEIADDDLLSFYDVSEYGGAQKQKKTTFGDLRQKVTGGSPALPQPTIDDYGKSVIVRATGTYGLGASVVPIFENFVINASEWQEDASATPFSYSVSKSTTAALRTSDQVELLNNDPYSFSKYGFNVDARGSGLKFLAVEQPTELVVLRVRIWRNQ